MLNIFDNNISDCDDEYFSMSDNSSVETFSSIPSLCNNLQDEFADVPKNLNIIHINAQSIPAHYSDMLASFNCNNVHAVLVSESWLKPCLPSTSYSLPGYRLIRNDRTGSGGGGVAIYLRANIPFSIISMSAQPPPPNAAEYLFIEVTLCHTKVLLGVFYCPSLRINYFSSFEKILEDLIPSYQHSIILGDFNTCLLKNDSRSFLLRSIISSSDMHILTLNATHHFPNATPSLLDLIFVSSLQHVAKHGQLPADAFSYHDLIFLSYKIRPPKPKPKIILQRNFSGINQELFLQDAHNIDWMPVVNAETVDDQIDIFNSLITTLYDVHAPLRAIKIKHLPAPWLTDDLKVLMHKKVIAKTKFKLCPSDENKAKYKRARNRCNTVLRDALRRHIHKSIENGDPTKIWKFLRTLGIGKSRPDHNPNVLDINSLNSYFSSSSRIDSTKKINTLQHISLKPIHEFEQFTFQQFSIGEVERSILSITSNAVGVDGISRNMITPILDIILPILCHILNSCSSNSVFPSLWKEAQIIPLPKKPNPQSFAEYRPISILPFLSKVFERLIQNQLRSYLSKHNLLNPLQSGFRAGHSTVSALLKITDDIRFGMEGGQLTVLTLLDFSNAFNTVDFDILLAILQSLNLSLAAIEWFRSYLYGRRQQVRHEDFISEWCDLSSGVPQGGVLSPLLFSIFINSVSQSITSPYHLYADDLQIYSQAPLCNLNRAIEITNENLCHISEWSNAYGLKVNPAKTQVIIIGSSRMVSRIDWSLLSRVTFEGVTIPFSQNVRNLGLIIDQCLSWGPQMEAVSRRLYASAGSLRRLRNFLTTATKVALAQSLLLPVLDYADACYLDLTEDQLNKLERLQNFCIRFIFGLRKYDHVSEYRKKLKWLPIRLRRNTHILSLLYTILFIPFSPHYLKERFVFLHTLNSHSLRSSENLTLSTPVHHSSFYNDSFTVHSIRLWNALPISIRQAQSLSLFKKQIKTFYLSI